MREWLNGLGRPLKTEIGSDIRVVQLGWPLGKPFVDGFGGGLYEVQEIALARKRKAEVLREQAAATKGRAKR